MENLGNQTKPYAGLCASSISGLLGLPSGLVLFIFSGAPAGKTPKNHPSKNVVNQASRIIYLYGQEC